MCGYVAASLSSPAHIKLGQLNPLSWRKTHFDFEVIAESVQRRQWSIVEARKPQSFPQTPLPFRSLSVKHQRTPVKTGIFLIWCVLAKCPMTTTTTTRKLISHQFVRFCQTNIDGDDDEVMVVTVCPYYCGVFLLCTNSQWCCRGSLSWSPWKPKQAWTLMKILLDIPWWSGRWWPSSSLCWWSWWS